MFFLRKYKVMFLKKTKTKGYWQKMKKYMRTKAANTGIK